MKIAPVSGDLLVKIAIGGGVLLLAAMALRRATDGISSAASSVWNPITSYVDGVRQTVGQAADAVYDGAAWVAEAGGGSLHNVPPDTLVPPGYYTPFWAGGALVPIPEPRVNYQADVRRIDNAIDNANDFAANQGYGSVSNDAGYDFRYF